MRRRVDAVNIRSGISNQLARHGGTKPRHDEEYDPCQFDLLVPRHALTLRCVQSSGIPRVSRIIRKVAPPIAEITMIYTAISHGT